MPLEMPAESGIPEWIHLLPGGGTVQTDDRRGPYRVVSLQALIDAAGPVNLPIDENHSIDIAGPRGEPSPARGHIVELQARADGLWGRAQWNAFGRRLMKEKAYLGISPVITHDLAKNITGVLRASLTNRPNLRGLTALHSQEKSMSFAAMAKAAGLGEDASEEAILAAITKLSGNSADTTALQSTLAEVGVALGVDQGAPNSAVLMAAKLAKQGETGIAEKFTALQSQFDALQETQARKASEAFVDGERDKGASAVNQQTRDDLVALHMTNPQTAEKLIKGQRYVKPREGERENPALQADQGDLVSRAKAYQAAHSDTNWTDAVLAVSEGKQ